MPKRALRPCPHPGCPVLVETGPCSAHQRERQQAADARRGNANQRGYDAAWQRRRKRILLRDLYQCQECKRAGRLTLVGLAKGDAHVDHLVPREQGGSEADENLETKCRSCHSSKTAREDGGFGNPRRGGVNSSGVSPP